MKLKICVTPKSRMTSLDFQSVGLLFACLTALCPGDAYSSSPVTNSGIMNIDGTFVNNGTLNNSDSSATLNINNGGTLNNNSTLNNSNHATVTNSSGGTLTNGGTLNNSSYATVNNYSDNLNNLGTLNNSSYATVNNYSGGILTNNGTLNNSNHATVTNSSGGTLTNDGTLNNSDTALLQNFGTLNDQGTLTNNGSFTNSGQFTINTTGQVDGTGSFTQTSGFTHVFSSLAQDSISIQGGTLAGDGNISTTTGLTIGQNGTLQAQTSAGAPATLNLTGAVNINGTLLTVINSTTAYDVLNVNGLVSFGVDSLLSFDLSGDASQRGGDSWVFLVANSFDGLANLHYQVSGLAVGLAYCITYVTLGATSPYLQFNLPEPSSLTLMGLGGLLLTCCRRPKRQAEKNR